MATIGEWVITRDGVAAIKGLNADESIVTLRSLNADWSLYPLNRNLNIAPELRKEFDSLRFAAESSEDCVQVDTFRFRIFRRPINVLIDFAKGYILYTVGGIIVNFCVLDDIVNENEGTHALARYDQDQFVHMIRILRLSLTE